MGIAQIDSDSQADLRANTNVSIISFIETTF